MKRHKYRAYRRELATHCTVFYNLYPPVVNSERHWKFSLCNAYFRYRGSIEYRDTWDGIVIVALISDIAQHYCKCFYHIILIHCRYRVSRKQLTPCSFFRIHMLTDFYNIWHKVYWDNMQHKSYWFALLWEKLMIDFDHFGRFLQ